jgi:hypothetical protein
LSISVCFVRDKRQRLRLRRRKRKRKSEERLVFCVNLRYLREMISRQQQDAVRSN